MTATAAPAASERTFSRLRAYNLAMGVLHAIQGILVLVLANDFTLPVTATFLEGPPGTESELETLFDVRIAWGVAAFLFLSALAHLLIITPGIFGWYRANLLRNRNYARWIEYSVSASIMIVLIAMLTGIGDAVALIGLFSINAAMILFGLLMEHYEEPGNANWLSFIFGCLAGIIPWLAIGLYLWGPTTDATAPTFVYAIFVSLFIFFNIFAVNMLLQYLRIGPWKDYLFGESVYILLSLTAKSALAWQVFSGTLAD